MHSGGLKIRLWFGCGMYVRYHICCYLHCPSMPTAMSLLACSCHMILGDFWHVTCSMQDVRDAAGVWPACRAIHCAGPGPGQGGPCKLCSSAPEKYQPGYIVPFLPVDQLGWNSTGECGTGQVCLFSCSQPMTRCQLRHSKTLCYQSQPQLRYNHQHASWCCHTTVYLD